MQVSDIIRNKDYDYIEWRIIMSKDNSETFVGSSKSKNGKLISLDGDIYYEDTIIERYEEWTNFDKNIHNGLTIKYKNYNILYKCINF